MWNARLDEAQARIKISWRNINNLRYADDTTLMAKTEQELKSLLLRVKEEIGKKKKKTGLKLNIKKTKIMTSVLITSWQIEGEKVETVRDFIFLVPEIIVDWDCSHEIKRCLLLGRKTMTNLDSILKSRDIILPTTFCIVRTVVFPVVMIRELDHKEGWALKNRCFWIVMLEKTLKSPLDCKEIKLANPKGNQPWIFIGRADAKAEAPVLWAPNVKSWKLSHWKRPWYWERSKAKGEEGGTGWEG